MLNYYNGSTVMTDAIGNTIYDGTFTYTWQHGRQLARVGYIGSTTEYLYEYNDSGIRTSKTVNGIKHIYTLSGSQIVTESWTQSGVEYFIVYLYDESGAPIGMQYRTSNYAYGEFDNYFFEKNLFGDVVAIYNETGTKIGSYKYDAWGVCNASVESTASTLEKKVVRTLNPFRYRGYYYDTETGFYYLQSRYYNPQWGRFLNADGYINANSDLIGYNMYAYCSNNPVMYTDPTGEVLSELAIAVIAGACISGGISLVVSIVAEIVERDFRWYDVGQVVISTVIGAAEGALTVLIPGASIFIGAIGAALDTGLTGAIDCLAKEPGASWQALPFDIGVSAVIGACSSVGGSELVKGKKILHKAWDSLDKIGKGIHPKIKKEAIKVVNKAKQILIEEISSSAISESVGEAIMFGYDKLNELFGGS